MHRSRTGSSTLIRSEVRHSGACPRQLWARPRHHSTEHALQAVGRTMNLDAAVTIENLQDNLSVSSVTGWPRLPAVSSGLHHNHASKTLCWIPPNLASIPLALCPTMARIPRCSQDHNILDDGTSTTTTADTCSRSGKYWHVCSAHPWRDISKTSNNIVAPSQIFDG